MYSIHLITPSVHTLALIEKLMDANGDNVLICAMCTSLHPCKQIAKLFVSL